MLNNIIRIEKKPQQQRTNQFVSEWEILNAISTFCLVYFPALSGFGPNITKSHVRVMQHHNLLRTRVFICVLFRYFFLDRVFHPPFNVCIADIITTQK